MYFATLTWWLCLRQMAFPTCILKKKKNSYDFGVHSAPISQVVWSWPPAAGGFLRTSLKRQRAHACSQPRPPWCLFWTWQWGPVVRQVSPGSLWCSLLNRPELPTCSSLEHWALVMHGEGWPTAPDIQNRCPQPYWHLWMPEGTGCLGFLGRTQEMSCEL